MKKLDMVVNFNNKNLICDNVIVPMWRAGANLHNPTISRAEISQVIQRITKPKVTREATERIVKVLDSKYKNSNLGDIAQSAHHLYAK